MGFLSDAFQGAAQVATPMLIEQHRANIMAERDAALQKLKSGEVAEKREYQTSERVAGEKFEAEQAKLDRESRKSGKGPSELQQAQTAKTLAETEKIKRESSGASKDEKAVAKQEKTETTKKNVERISELSKGVKTRDGSIKKARKFLRAFEKGSKSGAGRKAASYVPGVWTDQGQFDEELDAFAEIAAREKLKAVGEIRPTDADVVGMKRSLFGIARDEQTNINLLTEFIAEQEALDDELDSLRAAKKAGNLDTYAGMATNQEGERGLDLTAAKARLEALRSKLRER